MNEGYKARREQKHLAQKATRRMTPANILAPGLDLMPRIPRLIFISGKTHPQGNGGRKNRSRHLPEHTQAVTENASRTLAKEVDKALTPAVPSIESEEAL